ncbi:MAG: hypothetical protein II861_04110 [Methanomicrobium sp.]|nr:hypothetical protein [Methanomicrobium sp.]
MKLKIFSLMIICIMSAFLLSAGCTVSVGNGADVNSGADTFKYNFSDPYDLDSDFTWVDKKTEYDLTGTYTTPDNDVITYKIKFDTINNSNEVLLSRGSKKDFNSMTVTLSGTVTNSGTDRVIKLLNDAVYTLSASNVLTTPEGYVVQMEKTA